MGFDTATEVTLLVLAGAGAANGVATGEVFSGVGVALKDHVGGSEGVDNNMVAVGLGCACRASEATYDLVRN